jgi:hypothetical protein
MAPERGDNIMKKLIALVLAAAVFAPTLAFAGASTDAALGLGAFAVFNQILGGVGTAGRGRPAASPGGLRAGSRRRGAASAALRTGAARRREAVSGVRARSASRGGAPARVLPARPRQEGLVLSGTRLALLVALR